jgi:hypothetical protein
MDVYLGLALASIAASVTLQVTQKEKVNAALFVGQWVLLYCSEFATNW